MEAQGSPLESMDIQENTGNKRGKLGNQGEPRGALWSLGGNKRAQGSPGETRESPWKIRCTMESPGKSEGVQESLKETGGAQGRLAKVRETFGDAQGAPGYQTKYTEVQRIPGKERIPEKPREVPGDPQKDAHIEDPL